MKVYTARPSKPQQNTSGFNLKNKGSPTSKENVSISSKYLSLLKRKTDSVKNSPRNDNHLIRTTNDRELKELKDFNKVLHESRKDNTSSNKLKATGIKKELLVFSTGQISNNNQLLFHRSEADSNINQDSNAIYKTFRSPPVSSKLIAQNNIMSSFNSTGKNRSKSPLGKNTKQALLTYLDKKDDSVIPRSTSSIKNEKEVVRDQILKDSSYTAITKDIKVHNRCINHPEKKSKYYVKDDEIIKGNDDEIILPAFCSNCTFNLVKNGYVCEEIITTGEQFKKEKLAIFVSKLKQDKENCQSFIHVLENKNDIFNQLLNAEVNKVDFYFNSLIENLNAQRNVITERIMGTYNNSNNILADFKYAFSDYLSEFDTIDQDIEATYHKIIKSSELKPFNEILGNYEERINEFKETTQQLESLKIFNERVHFGISADAMKTQLNVKFDINAEYSRIVDTKSIDMGVTRSTDTTPNIRFVVSDSISELPIEDDPYYSQHIADDSIRKSAFSKSDVNVSFDKDFQIDLSHTKTDDNCDLTVSKIHESERSKSKLSNALERISNSQSVMNNEYQRLIGLIKKGSQHQMDENNNGLVNDENKDENNIFEFESENFNDMLNKQTPDLGVKLDQPEYLKDYYQALSNNVGNTDIRMNIEKNMVYQTEIKDQFKSQKVLFQC